VITVKRLPNGNILAPMRAENDDTIGDAMVELEPGDKMYDDWDKWLKEKEKK